MPYDPPMSDPAAEEYARRLAEDAETIKQLRDLLKDFIDTFDAGAVQMNSAEIYPDGHPPHPWHEEWLHRARTALTNSQL